MVEIPTNHQVQLEVGLQIKLTFSLQTYQITEINEDPESLLLKLESVGAAVDGFPEQITINQPSVTIGREPSNDITIQNSSVGISRLHAQVHYDVESNRWIYSSYAKNSGDVKHVDGRDVKIIDIGGDSKAVVADTAADIDDFEAEDVEALLLEGTTIHFHATMPAYVVSSDGKELITLLLERDKQDPRYPRQITVNKGKPVTLGRAPGKGGVTLAVRELSREHGQIAWQKELDEFVYTALGKYPPTIRLAGMLGELAHDYGHLSIDADEAGSQMEEIDELLTMLNEYKSFVIRVQGLEKNSIVNLSQSEVVEGDRTENSQKGYEIWLRVFSLLCREKLDGEAREKLDYMASTLAQMAEDREFLRDVERVDEPLFPDGVPGNFREFRQQYARQAEARATRVGQFALKKYEILTEEGEIFLITGFKGHHIVARIREESGRYFLATYNAGADAEPVLGERDRVLSMVEKEITDAKSLAEVIFLVTERKLSSYFSPMGNAVADMIDQRLHHIIARKDVRPPQHKGNCTTRSTREMLRDMLPHEVFELMHRYVSNPDFAPADDLETALNMKKQALEKIVGREGGEDRGASKGSREEEGGADVSRDGSLSSGWVR